MSGTLHLPEPRIERIRPLIPPGVLCDQLPLRPEQAGTVSAGRTAAHQIVSGVDDRLLVIVGPCSIHDPKAALDYAGRLAPLAEALRAELAVVMRAYFEKPRTTVGWKGLVNDPHLDGSGDVNAGLVAARTVLRGVLGLGLPAGCEFLDPTLVSHLADCVSWGSIGARTVESQIHRTVASGLSMPVGVKNRTDGEVGPALDALRAAAEPHVVTALTEHGVPAIHSTRGNPDCHLVLRGGRGRPNHDAASVAHALGLLRAAGLPERVIIDASHDNSGRDHRNQPGVAASVAAQVGAGQHGIVGVLMESFLVEGRQQLVAGQELRYGQSITDGCMGWDTTEEVLHTLAAAVRRRRTTTHSARF